MLIVACGVGGSESYAQQLKPAEQAKVNTLTARLNKAQRAQAQAKDALSRYRVFIVGGKVQAGDNTVATIYGKAISSTSGPGILSDDNFLYVKNPVDSEYFGGSYQGLCTFIGVVNGHNAYLPVARQADYVATRKAVEKWEPLINSIQAEINAVYLPYQKKAKNEAAATSANQNRIAQQRRIAEEEQAKYDAEEKKSVGQAQQRLAQAKREVEQAKREQAAKQEQNAKVAQIEVETAKAKAEKERIDAETQKQEQEAAAQKAKQLQEVEEKNRAAIEVLKNTPSIIAGKQLGKVQLGMTEAQVLLLMGKPESSLQLRKINTVGNTNGHVEYYTSFIPRKIRRDRYFLPATKGLDITYEGFTSQELHYFCIERGIEDVKPNSLKTNFVFDVFYLNAKVVQLESDSPEFFTSDKKNVQSEVSFEDPNHSAFLLDYRQKPDGGNWSGESGYIHFGNCYKLSSEGGFSFCAEALSAIQENENVPNIPSPVPAARLKLIVHAPNAFPYTGDYQLGISVLNKKGGRSDAENVEERKYPRALNAAPSALSQAADAVAPEGLEQKAKRKLGKFLPKF